MSRKKVAVVVDKMIYGGIERVCIDYLKIFKNLDYDVDVFVLDKETEAIIKEAEELATVRILNFSRFQCPEFYWKVAERKLFGKYLFPFMYLVVSIVMQMRKLFFRLGNRTKYDTAIAFSGHINDLTFVAHNFIKTNKKVAWLHGALYSYILGSKGYMPLYNRIKNLVVLVEDAQEETLIYNPTLNVHIKKLYNPISIAEREVDPKIVEELKSKYGNFLIMVSRFLYPHKDHETVVKAMQHVDDKNPNIKVLFIGDGPDFGKVKKQVADSNLQKQVIFMGTRGDVQNFYAACYGVVHASVAGEGLPTVILEGYSFAKPVICTDSKVGPREIMKNNEFGILCEVQNDEQFAKEILRLYEEPERHDHYAKMGTIRIKDFKPEVIEKQWQDIYRDLV